ncbi:uncharacterized transporter slc-17.2 [Aplysia californica]|uniref:Uncharacterized transporter slc-17.2 n=1 Tax=Aplysia californica TaxID=6500 RepID=A0ABM0JCS2_APLCA|nr:uncharacterized transporter slc-17.2 [Aplysia californica]
MFFDVSSNGLIAALPYIVQFVLQTITGGTADFIIKRTSISVATVRKFIDGLGKVSCIISLIAIGFVDCSQPIIAVVLLIICLSSIGVQKCGYYVNPLDIAPPYAGFIVALNNTLGAFNGFITPPLVGFITGANPARETWQIVFLMSAGVVTFGCIFYSLFASGVVQPWAKGDGDSPEATEIPLEEDGSLLEKENQSSDQSQSEKETMKNSDQGNGTRSSLLQIDSESPRENSKV